MSAGIYGRTLQWSWAELIFDKILFFNSKNLLLAIELRISSRSLLKNHMLCMRHQRWPAAFSSRSSLLISFLICNLLTLEQVEQPQFFSIIFLSLAYLPL